MTYSSATTNNTHPAFSSPFPPVLTEQASGHLPLRILPSQGSTSNSRAMVLYQGGNLQETAIREAWEIKANQKSIADKLDEAGGDPDLIVEILNQLTNNGLENSSLSDFLAANPNSAYVVRQALSDCLLSFLHLKDISTEAERIVSYARTYLESGLIKKDTDSSLEHRVIAFERMQNDPNLGEKRDLVSPDSLERHDAESSGVCTVM